MKPQKKFGLIKMQGFAMGAGKSAAKKTGLTAAVAKKPAPAAFAVDDDDDDEAEMRGLRKGGSINVNEINRSIVAQQQSSSRLTEKLKEDALAEDPSLYEYDAVYDSMQEERGDKKEKRKQEFDPSSGRERKEARYIQQLKKSADIRKVDEERIFQMKLKKEADAEAHIYGDTEKFVTTAYKEKLAEMGRWKAEDARLKALEDSTTVDGKKSMVGFYSNLLTKNLAMGSGDVSKDATSAYTIGSKRNDHIRDLEAKQRDKAEPAGEDGAAAAGGGDDGDVDEDALLQRMEESERKSALQTQGKTPAVPQTTTRSPDSEEEEVTSTKPPVAPPPPSKPETPPETPAELAQRREKEEAERLLEATKAAADAKTVREASAMSARERYLERKKAKALS
jgi:coiled-coil domain-containing protein 55